MKPLELTVRIEQKQPELPAFVVVPASRLASWKLTATTTVEATLDGVSLGRRSLKRWDDERWFLELRRDQLPAVGKAPGDRAVLVIVPASTEIPAEIQALLDMDPAARRRWEACTAAQQRMLREEVLAAKSPAARERRARKALLPPAEAPRPRIAGLSPEPRSIRIRILGRRLPGAACGPYREVHVALVDKAGCDPARYVSAAARSAEWETTIQVSAKDGTAVFRGPAVNGPPRERFLYLAWVARKGAAASSMFRRAKLRLDAVPAKVLADALRTGTLIGRLDLTAPDGMPVCASVRPPAISWASAEE